MSGSPAAAVAIIDRDEAASSRDFAFQGEYKGSLKRGPDAEPEEMGLQVVALGEGRFQARLLRGGLPGEPGGPAVEDTGISLEGTYRDNLLVLEDGDGMRLRYIFDRFTSLDERNRYLGHLEPVNRESATQGMAPPEGAVVLFDGSGLGKWADSAEMDERGRLVEGATTLDGYGDMRLHLEAKLGFMPEARGQRRANSGIYIQNRYEVQILDSFGLPPARDGNAALYQVSAPSVNAGFPPLGWQTYDVFFRAPRFDDEGNKTGNARVTVFLNGVRVQDAVELERGTGRGGLRREVERAELYLQRHTGPVRFRNVWLVEGESDPPDTPFLAPSWQADEAGVVRLDAAAGLRSGPIAIDRNHSGHSGDGFANFLADGSSVALRWLVAIDEPGRYELAVRYALATGTRSLQVRVNDEGVEPVLAFPATGAWNEWEELSVVGDFEAGTALIELRQIDGVGPNVDRLEIRPLD